MHVNSIMRPLIVSTGIELTNSRPILPWTPDGNPERSLKASSATTNKRSLTIYLSQQDRAASENIGGFDYFKTMLLSKGSSIEGVRYRFVPILLWVKITN